MTVDPSHLYWFHAFNRNSVGDILGVLTDGSDPHPNPDPDGDTRRAELALEIDPTRVYAYLGRTHPAFGKRAIAVTFHAFQGEVSPFDTGGLIKKIAPVCEWPDLRDKKAFLMAYTWTSDELSSLLADYPGEGVVDYLLEERPAIEGPDAVWPGRHAAVPIWSDDRNAWRSWTWEGRSPGRLPTGDALVGWTCHPDEYSDLMALISGAAPASGTTVSVSPLLGKYVDGGVGGLVSELRSRQVSAYA